MIDNLMLKEADKALLQSVTKKSLFCRMVVTIKPYIILIDVIEAFN